MQLEEQEHGTWGRHALSLQDSWIYIPTTHIYHTCLDACLRKDVNHRRVGRTGYPFQLWCPLSHAQSHLHMCMRHRAFINRTMKERNPPFITIVAPHASVASDMIGLTTKQWFPSHFFSFDLSSSFLNLLHDPQYWPELCACYWHARWFIGRQGLMDTKMLVLFYFKAN